MTTRSCSARRIFACRSTGMSPISSRNSVPPCASSKCPERDSVAPGERTLLVPEEHRLHELLGDRRAVDRHERPVLAPRQVVDRAGQDLLTGPGLPAQQHRVVGRPVERRALDHLGAGGTRGFERRVRCLAARTRRLADELGDEISVAEGRGEQAGDEHDPLQITCAEHAPLADAVGVEHAGPAPERLDRQRDPRADPLPPDRSELRRDRVGARDRHVHRPPTVAHAFDQRGADDERRPVAAFGQEVAGTPGLLAVHDVAFEREMGALGARAVDDRAERGIHHALRIRQRLEVVRELHERRVPRPDRHPRVVVLDRPEVDLLAGRARTVTIQGRQGPHLHEGRADVQDVAVEQHVESIADVAGRAADREWQARLGPHDEPAARRLGLDLEDPTRAARDRDRHGAIGVTADPEPSLVDRRRPEALGISDLEVDGHSVGFSPALRRMNRPAPSESRRSGRGGAGLLQSPHRRDPETQALPAGAFPPEGPHAGPPSMARPDPHPESAEPSRPRLLAASAGRTTFVPAGADDRVAKRFEAGSNDEPDRERHAADRAAGPWIARCVDESTDTMGRRTLLFERVPGRDLAAIVREAGPLRSTRVLAIARELARALAGVADRGLVHGDVKPGNVVVDVDDEGVRALHLIDFEHVDDIGSGQAVRGAFTGGTSRYAPPESFFGAAKSTAFDVYGFGCCVGEMLAGTAPREHGPDGSAFRPRDLRHSPDELRRLVDHCLADTSARPGWPEVLAELDAIARRTESFIAMDDHRLERARKPDAGDDRLWRRIDTTTPAPDAPLAELAAHARHVANALRRFPAARELRDARHSIRHTLADRLVGLPAETKRFERIAAFDTAARLVANAEHATLALFELGGPPLDGFGPDDVPEIVRDPNRVLTTLAAALRQRAGHHRALVERIEAAEAALDPDAANAALDAVAATYGGASEITSGLKERHVEFEFAIGRIAGGRQAVESCQAIVDGADELLAPVVQLIDACSGWVADPPPSNCRNLLRSLDELLRDRPHLEAVVREPRRALHDVLERATHGAWDLVTDATESLHAVPVPIRPLQATLNRLDRADYAGALVDLEGRSRAELLDAIESIHTGVERAALDARPPRARCSSRDRRRPPHDRDLRARTGGVAVRRRHDPSVDDTDPRQVRTRKAAQTRDRRSAAAQP